MLTQTRGLVRKGRGERRRNHLEPLLGPLSFACQIPSQPAAGGRLEFPLSLSQSCFFFFFSSILGGGRNRLHQLASWLCCSFHHHIFQILSGGRRREVGPTADRDLLLASLLKLGSLSSLSSLRPQNGRRRKKKKGGGGEIRLKEGEGVPPFPNACSLLLLLRRPSEEDHQSSTVE